MQYLNYVEVDWDTAMLNKMQTSNIFKYIVNLTQYVSINNMQYLNYVEVDWDTAMLDKMQTSNIFQYIVNLT